APVYNWTGWYVGVNAGASFGKVKTDFNVAPISAGSTTIPAFAFSNTESPSGFIGGGQVGYNWQYSSLIVVGLEADIQGALERDTHNFGQDFNFVLGGGSSTQCGVGVGGSPCTTSTSYTTHIDWFGTVRARIGYL